MRIAADSRALMDAHGIHGPATEFIEDGWRGSRGMLAAFDAMPAQLRYLGDASIPALIANDAQPGLVTTANAGIPAFLANIMDPQVVRVLVSPTRAAEIYGETKRGDWTTASIEFPFVEATGQVTSYGDWNNNGNAGANVNWMPRQSYYFQTIAQWGERELARYGLAGIDYAAQIQMSIAIVMNKFLNKSYFFGIGGLINYGTLNDPNLIAPITPLAKAAGGVAWGTNNATAIEVFNDVNALFTQLVTQMAGWVVDSATPMTLVVPSTLVPALNRVSSFSVSARSMITEAFPNLKIESAPELATTSGNVMQLFIRSLDGVETVFGAFTEKMRSHAVVTDLSGWKQKKSGGTWGAVNRRPIAMAQMLGI